MRRVEVVSLDVAGANFLDIVVESGHLDEAMLDQINDRLLEMSSSQNVIGVDDVRRVVAETLFDRWDDLEPDARRMLEMEWPLLFN